MRELQLAELDEPIARQKVAALAERFRAGEAAPAWKLELWQAAKASGIELPQSPDRFEFGGDPKRGKKLVMEHAAAQCIRCHMIGGVGSKLGPDLSKIGATRDRTKLVASMLEPNREISDGFGTVLIKMKSGEAISGVLAQKSDEAWTITLADGTEKKVAPDQIEQHTLSSSMPPVGALMTPDEIRDVISYLAELK